MDKILYIIGNGFDLKHGLKTTYNDFKKYLVKEYKISEEDIYLPEGNSKPDGSIEYDEKDIASLIVYIINQTFEGENWGNLEENLSKIDFSEYFEGIDFSLEYNPWEAVYGNQDKADILVNFIEILNFFNDWIKSINLKRVKPLKSFKKLFDINDNCFLTFNYTKTLESVYEISVNNICHIHGKAGEKELYFGHGTEDLSDVYDELQGSSTGSEDSISNLIENLKKDTKKAYGKSKNFFENLKDIDKIYSYGFSFSDVDLFYVKKIIEQLNNRNVTWFLSSYEDENTRKIYVEKLKRCGFSGKIDTFTIE